MRAKPAIAAGLRVVRSESGEVRARRGGSTKGGPRGSSVSRRLRRSRQTRGEAWVTFETLRASGRKRGGKRTAPRSAAIAPGRAYAVARGARSARSASASAASTTRAILCRQSADKKHTDCHQKPRESSEPQNPPASGPTDGRIRTRPLGVRRKPKENSTLQVPCSV